MLHFSSLPLLLLALLATAHQYFSFALETKVRDYKPSLSDLSVPNRENPKILLVNFPGQSLVLNLLNGEPSASNYFVHLARQAANSDPGFFYVDAPKGYGVMAVIQQLHLRRISDSHSLLQLVNNCKDYLIFEGYSGEKMESTNLICGALEKGDRNFYPRQLHGPKFFNSPNGRIKVTFRNHYSYDGNELVAQNTNTNPNPATNANDNSAENKVMLTVQIAFTAYSKNSSCEPSAGGNATKFQCGLDKCIDHSLVCDDTINCSPDENTDFGLDERNCSSAPPSKTPTHDHDQTQRKHRINRLHHTHAHSHTHSHHSSNSNSNSNHNHSHNLRDRHNSSSSGPFKISRTTESNSGETDFFDLEHDHENEDGDGSDSDSTTSSKPPQMTTIIILVISLTLITICGYFWSWLSQLCCFFRSFRSFPRSGGDQRISPSFTATSPAGNISGNIPSNIGIAYYVPAIILNNNNNNSSSNNNNNSETNSQNPDSHNGGKSGEMPPSYETLFPQKE